MLTRRLAEFVIDTVTKEIPAEVFTGSRHALIDTIGWYRTHDSWWRPLKRGHGYREYYRKQYGRSS